MTTSTNVTALKNASTKKSARKVMSKVEKTQNIMVRALAKTTKGKTFSELNRAKLLGTLEKTCKFTGSKQSSTYYHNQLRLMVSPKKAIAKAASVIVKAGERNIPSAKHLL